jgi:UDP-N-acetyl-2-amino-2-deoxyglucuronate dehydrogenase
MAKFVIGMFTKISCYKMKLKFAIVGLGNIGSRHLQVLSNTNEAKVVALVDNNKHVLAEYKQHEVAAYANLKKALSNPEIDVVNICTPHHLHAAMAIEALHAKKHVIVEKPMCLKVTDAVKMIAAAKHNNRKLIVVKQNRYNEPVQAVHHLLTKNKLGKIYAVQCNVLWNRRAAYYNESAWRGKLKTEGGALFTQASHFVDLLVWWFGEVKTAKTFLQTLSHPIEIEDNGNAILQFEKNISAIMSWTTNVFEKNYEGSVTIIAEHGTVKIGGAYLNELEYWNVKNCPAPKINSTAVAPNLYKQNYQGSSSNHDKVMNDVVNLLLHQQHIDMVEGEEAIKTIRSIVTMYAKKNRV